MRLKPAIFLADERRVSDRLSTRPDVPECDIHPGVGGRATARSACLQTLAVTYCCGVPSEDHVSSDRAVYDMTAETYVQFAGTEINSLTEHPIDRSLLLAFVELIRSQAVRRVADVGCGPGRVASLMADHGLSVLGVDVSPAMIAIASAAHPHIEFVEGQLDALPIESRALAGAVCWYSIIHTPRCRLVEAFKELARVLVPGGLLLLAFQAEGESLHREDAFGSGLPLTSYRHSVSDVVGHLEESGFRISTTAIRAAELEHETTSQGFVIASGPGY